MTENVEKIYPDNELRSRFDFISKFLDFTNDDIRALNQLLPYIQPMIPVIVDKVYRKLFSFDITKQYFFRQHSCFDTIFSSTNHSSPSFEREEIEYRKNMLSKYLIKILAQQEWNDTFLHYLSYVGRIHTYKLGTPTINVDYMHIAILIGFIEHIIIDIISKADHLTNEKKHKLIIAINKFFRIQNDFFKIHY